jgi:ATP-binding cassette, subfamily B, bacterial
MRKNRKHDILYAKKYNLFDLVTINFIATPWFCVLSIVFMIIDALMPAVQIFITANFIDTAINIFKGIKEYNAIYLPLILIILTIFYRYLYNDVLRLFNMKSYIKLNEEIKTFMIAKRAKIEYKHMENNETWELISRTCNDPVNQIAYGFHIFLNAANIPIRVSSIFIILLTQVWWAGLAIFTVSIPLFYIAVKNGRRNYDAFVEANKHERKALYIDDILTSRESGLERTMFSYSDAISRKWKELYDKGRKIRLKAELRNLVRLKIGGVITVVAAMLIAGVLISPLKQHAITVGMFIALVEAVADLQWIVTWTLSGIIIRISETIEFMKDLTGFMALSETKDALESADKNIYDQKFESIEFIDVSFKYPGTDKYILKGLSMKLSAGFHYAFVGINGAGKTTIIKLLTGMYDDFEGEILINSRNIKSYGMPQIKAIFSVVYQDFARYCLSVRENIEMGNIDATDTEINRSIETVDLAGAISNLPNGIETNLGKIRENSSDISGGEWQRLAIARTLVSRSPVRILDEPTASLDAIAESNIYEMFDRISAGKTTLLITHRLGATRTADEIILIEDGKVTERGPHVKLMTDNGQYAKMFESQRSWYQ